MSMAPLILEESRCILADALKKSACNDQGADTFTLELSSIEEKYTKLANIHRKYAPLILNCLIVGTNTNQGYRSDSASSKWTRPGSVMLLRRKYKDGKSDSKPTTILACIVPIGGQQLASSSLSSAVSLMVFRREDLKVCQFSMDNDIQDISNEDKELFYATNVTTLIAQVRQIEACLRMVKVSFLRRLLGQKNATHIRFDNCSDEEEGAEEVVCDVDDDDDDEGFVRVLQEGYYVGRDEAGSSGGEDGDDDNDGSDNCGSNLTGLLKRIPTLNKTQERAATLFLHSPPESLVLVQG